MHGTALVDYVHCTQEPVGITSCQGYISSDFIPYFANIYIASIKEFPLETYPFWSQEHEVSAGQSPTIYLATFTLIGRGYNEQPVLV